jgi:homogentisate 1,2-dioxygenase
MEKGHILREFPWQRQAREDYKETLPRIADGSPPDGLYVESKSFDTFLYRTEPLTVIDEFEEVGEELKIKKGARKPRAFSLFSEEEGSFPRTIVKSNDLAISVLKSKSPQRYYGLRNGDGNELFFVHSGAGRIYTDFGYVYYKTGDYIFIPRGTIYLVSPSLLSRFVIAEIPKQVFLPRHYWFSDFFPYDSSAIVSAVPTKMAYLFIENCKKGFEVFLKTDGAYRTKLVYPFSPFNCVGWQGKMYPFKLSLEHIHTIVSPTFHVPPTALITFTTEDMSVMISTFKPRWVHSLPYNHLNDHEEFLFYHAGEYSARTTLKLGDATLHPVGIHHGPQPDRLKAWKRVDPKDLPWREEVAIMFESRAPLAMYPEGKKVEIPGYGTSWSDEWEEVDDE